MSGKYVTALVNAMPDLFNIPKRELAMICIDTLALLRKPNINRRRKLELL